MQIKLRLFGFLPMMRRILLQCANIDNIFIHIKKSVEYSNMADIQQGKWWCKTIDSNGLVECQNNLKHFKSPNFINKQLISQYFFPLSTTVRFTQSVEQDSQNLLTIARMGYIDGLSCLQSNSKSKCFTNCE